MGTKIKRNELLETDGLAFESDTHEWFADKSTTTYAKKPNLQGIALPNLVCLVVRSKETGEYDRVVMSTKSNQIIYHSKSLEEVGVHIDKLKLLKTYGTKI